MQLFTASPFTCTVHAPQLPGVAADVRSGEPEVVADEVDEQAASRNLVLDLLAVDLDARRCGS